MITRLEIKNFRNIKEVSYDFYDKCSIFTGMNGLGKSNTLNALNWLLTNTLLTDNYGKGENDIDSIVPIDHVEGQKTEVSIYLETGTKFTKFYNVSYNKEGKCVGHDAKYAINDVDVSTRTEFYKELYTALNFYPTFTSLKIAEERLYTDPLYALQKLEPKDLRKLLVAMGCSVTNEEMYNSGYEYMRAYELKYGGKWDSLRAEKAKNKKDLESQINTNKKQLESFVDYANYDDSKLKACNKMRDDLVIQRSALNKGEFDSQISELKNTIKEKEFTLSSKIQSKKNEFDVEYKKLELERQNEMARINDSKANELKSYVASKNAINTELASYESILLGYQNSLSDTKKEIEALKYAGKDNQSRKTELTIKLNSALTKNYDFYITCPNCGTSFPASEEKLKEFEEDKAKRIQELKDQISECSSYDKTLENKYIEFSKNVTKLNSSIAEMNDKITAKKNELIDIEKAISDINNKPEDTSKIDELNKKLSELNRLTVNISFPEDEKELNTLRNELKVLETNNQESIRSKVSEINDKIAVLDNEINDLNDQKSKHNSYLKCSETGTKLANSLNDLEFEIGQIEEFIHALIARINQKATQKIGFEFVMLEENLTNDNLTEVCYAIIDGVPFKDLNTSKKMEYGIKFIERAKEIAVTEFGTIHNELPILADRLEGIDTLTKVKNLSYEQLICTRVSEDETIKVI